MTIFAHDGEVHSTAVEAATHQSSSSMKTIIIAVGLTLLFVAGALLISRLFNTPVKEKARHE